LASPSAVPRAPRTLPLLACPTAKAPRRDEAIRGGGNRRRRRGRQRLTLSCASVGRFSRWRWRLCQRGGERE